MTRTPYMENSYFIVENDLIWYINDNDDSKEASSWPQSLSYVFPSIDGPIDSILYDDDKNEFLIFKVYY